MKDVLTNLHTSEEANSFYRPVYCFILNPKSLDIEELYGGINKVTMEWHDGLLALAVRAACNVRCIFMFFLVSFIGLWPCWSTVLVKQTMIARLWFRFLDLVVCCILEQTTSFHIAPIVNH